MQTKHCKRLVKTAAIPSSKMTVMDVIRQKVCRHLVVIYNTSPVQTGHVREESSRLLKIQICSPQVNSFIYTNRVKTFSSRFHQTIAS